MPKPRLHSAPTGAYARRISMDHRIKSGGDGSKQWLGIARAKVRRENEILFTSPRWGEVASGASGFGCLGFEFSNPLTPTLSPPGGGSRGRAARMARHCERHNVARSNPG